MLESPFLAWAQRSKSRGVLGLTLGRGVPWGEALVAVAGGRSTV